MIFSIANLILSILLVQKFGLIGVAAATAITQILFYAVVTPIMTSKVINFSLTDYFKKTYLRIVPASLLLFALLSWFAKYHPPGGFLSLIGLALIGAAAYLALAYWTLLDASERELANRQLKRLAEKIVSKLRGSSTEVQ